MYEKLKRFLLHPTSPYYSYTFGVVAFLYGLWIVSPFGHLIVEAYFGDGVWGGLAIFIGVSLIVSTKFFHGKKWHLRSILSGFYFWLFFGVSILLSNAAAPGWIIFFWFSYMFGAAYINHKLNERELLNQEKEL